MYGRNLEVDGRTCVVSTDGPHILFHSRFMDTRLPKEGWKRMGLAVRSSVWVFICSALRACNSATKVSWQFQTSWLALLCFRCARSHVFIKGVDYNGGYILCDTSTTEVIKSYSISTSYTRDHISIINETFRTQLKTFLFRQWTLPLPT